MLRTRLILGLMCLLVILLSMGLYSINRCSELGHRIEAISRDNDRAGQNLQQMKRSGAAMTGALLSLMTEDHDGSRHDFSEASKSFQEALDEENSRHSATADEKKLIAKLTDSYKAYDARARAFLLSVNRLDPAWRSTAHKLGQDTGQLLDLVDQLAVAHEQGLGEGNRNAAADINDTIRSLILLMIAAVVVAIYASVRLSSGLLSPLISLTTSIQQVGQGNLDQQVPVLSRDELGVLATSFNQMAAQLRQYRATTSVELVRLNMTIRATLASFPDPIFVLNSQGEVEFRNPEADQLAMKLLFSGVTRLPEKVDEKVEHVRATGQDYLPTLFKDALKFHLSGQDRYFLPRIILLRDENRDVFGVAVILEDITRMLLLDDVKSGLISTVSHELKTPLTSVRMALYLLYEKTVGSLNEKQADLVSTAREDADRLLKTLNDLLDLAKLEQGPSQLELTQVSSMELVETAVREIREIAHAAEITLKTEMAPDLPDVRIDRQRMAYVFTNLITNAIKYSPKGSEVLVRADLGQTRNGRPSVRFSVKDQGLGIALEYQEHIFDRFYRVPGTNKSGAGLGLSIAREVVVAHQGEIGVISQPGHGSEFFFMLPFISRETQQ
jgi:two-component system, NtrC family, sensor histidine kinase KinB